MASPIEFPKPLAGDLLADPLFAPFDVVALSEAWSGLEAGVWGTVLAVLAPERYEVEFTDREGAPLMVAEVPEELLQLVWADAE
jgi:hypothetical protein